MHSCDFYIQSSRAIFEHFVSHSFLPDNFTICSSISTANAGSDLCFFQLLTSTNEPWINVCLMGAGKDDQHHRVKLMVTKSFKNTQFWFWWFGPSFVTFGPQNVNFLTENDVLTLSLLPRPEWPSLQVENLCPLSLWDFQYIVDMDMLDIDTMDVDPPFCDCFSSKCSTNIYQNRHSSTFLQCWNVYIMEGPQ